MPQLSTFDRIKSIIGGSLGNLVEWYDWYIYSFCSLYFAGAFFPKADQTVQLLNTAGIFAIGFLMRPIGGWLMGTYADKKGRKTALTFSVLLMSLGSLIIAVIPGYKQIGIAAPILLLPPSSVSPQTIVHLPPSSVSPQTIVHLSDCADTISGVRMKYHLIFIFTSHAPANHIRSHQIHHRRLAG